MGVMGSKRGSENSGSSLGGKMAPTLGIRPRFGAIGSSGHAGRSFRSFENGSFFGPFHRLAYLLMVTSRNFTTSTTEQPAGGGDRRVDSKPDAPSGH
jgi:hypothetical protein